MGIPKPEHSKFEIRLPNKKKLLSTVLNTESERRLIYKTWELLNRPANSLEDHGALFYPSAGYDLVLPPL